MRHSTLLALSTATLLLASCGGPSSASLSTTDQKASYGIGRNVGRTLSAASERLDVDAFVQGVRDALNKQESPIPDSAIQTAIQAFTDSVRAQQAAEQTAAADANEKAGEAFRKENGAKEGVTTLKSGLQYQVLEPGNGPKPGPDDTVTINYKGTLPDGTVFDSSYERNQPATFPVSGVIPGFSEGLQLMPVGSKYRFVIPGNLAYGRNGSPPTIGPNQTLVFEVELLSIK